MVKRSKKYLTGCSQMLILHTSKMFHFRTSISKQTEENMKDFYNAIYTKFWKNIAENTMNPCNPIFQVLFFNMC